MKQFGGFYKGRKYRSLLEIKWAIFFDYLGWQYEYEPFGLKGWIPDFALYGANDQIILVEIKPITAIDKVVCEEMSTADDGEHELLLLGLSPVNESKSWNSPALGWLTESKEYSNWGPDWGHAMINANQRYGFFHEHNSYRDRITGEGDGDSHLNLPTWDEIELLWNQASNKAQWVKS